MINLGSDIIFLSGKLTPPFRRALRHFRQNLLSGAMASTASGTNSIVAKALMRAEASSKLDEETVATLFRLANDQVLTGAEKKRAFVALGFEGLPPAHLVTLFRRAARLAIFNLWAQRAVILPIGSQRAWSVEHALLRNIAPPTASFCLNYGEKPLATSERVPAKSLEQRMRYRVVPWLPATDWTSPEYICESDIVALRVFERQGEGSDRQYLRSVAVAVDELQRNFPETCGVDRASIDRINQYILGGYFKEVSFQDLNKAVEKRKIDKIDKIDRIKKNNKIQNAKNASKRREFRSSKSGNPENLMYLNTERIGWFQDLSVLSFLPVQIDAKLSIYGRSYLTRLLLIGDETMRQMTG
ncbi:hypothetical protein HH800_09725 [Sphingobium yanoikuyae]|uniref:Uncharacterized protein n=1 Tax=Sphingobium yanoikuyae TaxID=13690 RepID=A0A6M4G533_SPHYA|nr:hypothetical protein [Sphingobium yanoikuyae]QJR02432.1 hypothetical protein HH800_09725 [Sphingobium yanoikuyae]